MRNATTILTCLLMILVLAGCAPKSVTDATTFSEMAYPEAANGPSLNPDQHLRLGDRMAAEGHGQTAYLHYEKALAGLAKSGVAPTDRRYLDLRARKGLVLLSDGQTEAALVEFQAILAQSPDHATANEGAGAVYLKSGLLDEAGTHLRRALEADPTLWRTHQLLGVLESRQGDLERSVQELTTSLELAPGRADTLNNLGVTRLMRQEYSLALEAFRKALLAGASKSRTYNNIGLTLARMGHRKEALEAFKYAGTEASAYNNLGYVLLLQGEVDAAASCFEKAVELSPSYYAKAFENLKQARMARGFLASGLAAARPAALLETRPAPAATDAEFSALPSPSEPGEAPAAPSPAAAASAATAAAVTAASTAAAPEAATQASASTGTRLWGFHVASCKQPGAAQEKAARYAAGGVETNVIRVTLPTRGVWYRVFAGRFASPEEAEAHRNEISAAVGPVGEDYLTIKSFEDQDQATPPAPPVL